MSLCLLVRNSKLGTEALRTNQSQLCNHALLVFDFMFVTLFHSGACGQLGRLWLRPSRVSAISCNRTRSKLDTSVEKRSWELRQRRKLPHLLVEHPVAETNYAHSPRFEDPVDFGEHLFRLLQVLDAHADEDGVEAAVARLQLRL